MDGNDTFHGMGMIAGITPATNCQEPVSRCIVSGEELKQLAKIDITYYKPPTNSMASLFYQELDDLNVIDTTRLVDFLSAISWPLRAPTTGWSGFMQMIRDGEYPGKSDVVFLPMIDMNASDISCVYSTLNFICSQARCYGVTPVVTFDQPLYWKAYTIIANEMPVSSLKSLVLRLGGFHTEMSFLGCIGHIMSGSGLQEILEIVYASNTVPHMLNGKVVARAIRGHMIVDTAIHALLMSKIFKVDTQRLESKVQATVEQNEFIDMINQQEDLEDVSSDEMESRMCLQRNSLLDSAANIYDELSNGEMSIEEACQNQILLETKKIFEQEVIALRDNRTAQIWIHILKWYRFCEHL